MNKNTRKLRQLVRAAGKHGQDSVEYMTPVYNYHNYTNDDYRSNPAKLMVKRKVPTARVVKGIVSSNRKRNTAQRVLVNEYEGGIRESITRHEPLLRGEYLKPKNHKYLAGQYRQPRVKYQPDTTAVEVASELVAA